MKQRTKITDEELAEIASGYTVLKDFYKEQGYAYREIRKRGLKEELCGHMKRGDNYRTESDYAEIVAKYETMRELREKEPQAYAAMQQRGLIKKLCGKLKYEVKPSYSDDELREVSSRYTDYSEFFRKEHGIWQAIHNRGLTDELCGHMYRKKSADISEKELAAIASGYNDLEQFMKDQPHAYERIRKRGLKNRLCGHMKRKWCERPDSELAEVASSYYELKEFREKEPEVYRVIYRRGLLDELCSHMERRGKWSKRKIYAFTFSDGYAYIGLSLQPEYRMKQHIKEDEDSPVFLHIQKSGASYEFNILTDWLDAAVAGAVEEDFISKYKADGWKMLNKAKGGALGGAHIYTRHRIQSMVSMYDSFEVFRKEQPRLYRYLRKNHLVDEYCSHMERPQIEDVEWAKGVAAVVKKRVELMRKHNKAYRRLKEANLLDVYYPNRAPSNKKIWTIENSLNKAKKCKTRTQLARTYPMAYRTLMEAGMIDLIPTNQIRKSEEEHIKIAKQCKSRGELLKRFPSTHRLLLRHNLLDKLFPK